MTVNTTVPLYLFVLNPPQYLGCLMLHHHTMILRGLFVPFQEAIEDAEKGDFGGVRRVLRLLESPFDPPPATEGEKNFLRATPDWAADLVCTCSS